MRGTDIAFVVISAFREAWAHVATTMWYAGVYSSPGDLAGLCGYYCFRNDVVLPVSRGGAVIFATVCLDARRWAVRAASRSISDARPGEDVLVV